jgi:hypothetical protein
MLYLANKTIPMPLNYQPSLLVQVQTALLLTSPALDTEKPLSSFSDSPLITKPPVPATMADKLIAVLSCLLIVSARKADPSSQSNAGRSYVVFGKQDNTDAIELSAIAAGTSTDGFVINLSRRR